MLVALNTPLSSISLSSTNSSPLTNSTFGRFSLFTTSNNSLKGMSASGDTGGLLGSYLSLSSLGRGGLLGSYLSPSSLGRGGLLGSYLSPSSLGRGGLLGSYLSPSSSSGRGGLLGSYLSLSSLGRGGLLGSYLSPSSSGSSSGVFGPSPSSGSSSGVFGPSSSSGKGGLSVLGKSVTFGFNSSGESGGGVPSGVFGEKSGGS